MRDWSIGADPNFVDKDGLTPLYFACSDGREDLVDKLIAKGADANADGCLQISLDLMYNFVARSLIKNGADVNKVRPYKDKVKCFSISNNFP